MRQADIDEGRKDGLSNEAAGVEETGPGVGARSRNPAAGDGVFCEGACPEMMYPLVQELAVDRIPVTVTCRVLGFSKRGYYRWKQQSRRSSKRPGPAAHHDFVKRTFTAERFDQVWVGDITEHPTPLDVRSDL